MTTGVSDPTASDPLTDGFVAHGVAQIACSHCGTVVDVSGVAAFAKIPCTACDQTLVVPVQIGKFFAFGDIGHGGMGTVFEAWDPELERMVAIKIVHHMTGEAAQADFVRESRAAAALIHPNVARVYDFGFHDGQPFLVMELVRGRHLDVIIREDHPLDVFFVVETAIAVTEGLAEANKAGLIHGDIKPENILFDAQHVAKLVDFGLASMVGDIGGDRVRGTPFYIPPERLQRQRLDARSDIYSLGATLFHALTGRPPFVEGAPREVALARLSAEPPRVRSLRPDVPEALDRLVHRMLAREPGRRHPTTGSLLGDLRQIAAMHPGGVSTTVASSVGGGGVRAGDRRIRIGGIAAGLAAGVVLLLFLWQGLRPGTRATGKPTTGVVRDPVAEDPLRRELIRTLRESWLTPWSNGWTQIHSAIEQVEARQAQIESLPDSTSRRRLMDTGYNLHMQSLPALGVAFENSHRVVIQTLEVLIRTQDPQSVEQIAQRMETLERALQALTARTATELAAARRHMDVADRALADARNPETESRKP